MRVPQPDIIEHFGNADAVPQPPERCLSRQARIVRYCLRRLSLLKCETNNEKIVGRDALIAPQRNGKQLTQTRKSSVGGR